MKSDKQIKKEALEEVANQLLALSRKYKNSDKGEGVQDAYALVIGLKNPLK